MCIEGGMGQQCNVHVEPVNCPLATYVVPRILTHKAVDQHQPMSANKTGLSRQKNKSQLTSAVHSDHWLVRPPAVAGWPGGLNSTP